MPRLLMLCALLLPLFSGCAKSGPSALSPGYTDAVELKLKSRELAEQMLATMPNDAIQGFVAMPTAFVNQNNTSQSSPMGRLMAESLFYEFNQRGFPTREYRLNGAINVQGGRDDLALAANQMVSTTGAKMGRPCCGHLLCGQGRNLYQRPPGARQRWSCDAHGASLCW